MTAGVIRLFVGHSLTELLAISNIQNSSQGNQCVRKRRRTASPCRSDKAGIGMPAYFPDKNKLAAHWTHPCSAQGSNCGGWYAWKQGAGCPGRIIRAVNMRWPTTSARPVWLLWSPITVRPNPSAGHPELTVDKKLARDSLAMSLRRETPAWMATTRFKSGSDCIRPHRLADVRALVRSDSSRSNRF